MKIVNIYISIILFILFFIPGKLCFAYECPSGLKAALICAWKNNPDIKAARCRYEAASFYIRSESALSSGELTAADTIAGENASDSAIEFSQPLEINGIRRARKEAAAARAEEERAALLIEVENISSDVKEAYWELIRLHSVYRLKQETEVYFKDLEDKIKRQIDLGTLPGFHLLRAEVALSSATQEVKVARRELLEKQNEFKILIGATEDYVEETDLNDFIPDDLSLKFPPSFSPEQDHPLLYLASAKIHTVDKDIKEARSEMYPDLHLIMRKEAFDDKGGAGLKLSVPFLDWGKISNRIKGLQKIAEGEKISYGKAVEDIDRQRSDALIALRTYESIIYEYDAHLIKNASELVRIVEKAYEKGAAGFLELMDAKKNQTDVEMARKNVVAEYFKSLARLEKTYGISSKEYTELIFGGKNER